MDDFIKKQNIPNINPSTKIKTSETKPVVKELTGNFFETFAKSDNKFSWNQDVDSEISKIKRQTKEIENVLKTGAMGMNINIVG